MAWLEIATPDHTIRTKNQPLIVPAPHAGKLDDFAAAARDAVARFVADYHAYFARNNAAVGGIKRELDPCRGHPGAGAGPLLASGARPRMPRSPPDLAES